MCGIIGAALRQKEVQPVLLDALARMEYRGYDSAGVCTVNDAGALDCVRAVGKLCELRKALQQSPCRGRTGIGHTRWATHGAPSVENAHPHRAGPVAVVHNGIVENHEALRQELAAQGASFASETDTEVVAHLFAAALRTKSPDAAWRDCVARLEGAFALCALVEGQERIWFARRGSPLLLGRSARGVFAASDALALAGLADEVCYLDEGDYGVLDAQQVHLWDLQGRSKPLHWRPSPVLTAETGKAGYAHYMEKEIHEQPAVVARLLDAYIHDGKIRFPQAESILQAGLPERIVITACGTSYHAGLLARWWIERLLRVPVEVDVASEYRYRDPIIGRKTWMIAISQSGETADTLEAMRMFKARTPENPVLALCNVPSSSMAREADGMIELLAGPEIGVASTKAFTAQIVALALFALRLGLEQGAITRRKLDAQLAALRALPEGIEDLLERREEVRACVPLFADAHGALFLGRGPGYPIALEGALKLKEITYLHAEGYPAGEMKHGPIALVDARLPVVVLAPRRHQLEKVLANLEEVRSRGARVILLTDIEQPPKVQGVLHIPNGDVFTTPALMVVPLQLLAYEVAVARGCDVDQPRNLAKSVTVE